MVQSLSKPICGKWKKSREGCRWSMINNVPNLLGWVESHVSVERGTEWQNYNRMVGGLYAVLCFTLLAAWFDPHKIERSVAIKLYFHANLWKRLIEFWPPVQRRPGMQISGAVKYPVLEVKWQQKLWLEPCNNQSRCFDCWEPAKKSPGFAQARAPQTVIKPFAGKLLLLSASPYTLHTTP